MTGVSTCSAAGPERVSCSSANSAERELFLPQGLQFQCFGRARAAVVGLGTTGLAGSRRASAALPAWGKDSTEVRMNTANLQVEGLLIALSRLLDAMRDKGILTPEEIETALREAGDAAQRDAQTRNISPAQAEGILFPIRFLRVATNLTYGPAPTFTDMATMIGEARDHRG